jgi:drug/metabolite transporter (DMT)-like permease
MTAAALPAARRLPAPGPRTFLVLSAASFGGAWVAAPWAVSEIPPFAVACLRFAVAAILLYAWCRIRRVPVRATRADIPIVAGVAATSVLAYNLLFLDGVRLAPASHGAVIVPGFIPGLTLALAWLFLGERPRRRQVAGALIGLAGLALVIGPGFVAGHDAALGDLMFAGGALAWSAYAIVARRATRRFDASVITFLAAASGAGMFLALSLIAEPGGLQAYGQASLKALAGVAYLGSIGTVIAFVFFYLGMQRLGAARAAAYSVLIPLFGVAATTALLGQSLEPISLLGAAIVVGGLWLTQSAVPAPPPARQRPTWMETPGSC